MEKVEKGSPTMDVLAGFLPEAIARIPFQKKMRWGEGTFEFGRPIHWIVALFGDEVIHFDAAGVSSGNVSMGHRFLSAGKTPITDASRYVEEMRSAYVIVDDAERMNVDKGGNPRYRGKDGRLRRRRCGPPGRDLLHHGISPRPHGRVTMRPIWSCPGPCSSTS